MEKVCVELCRRCFYTDGFDEFGELNVGLFPDAQLSNNVEQYAVSLSVDK